MEITRPSITRLARRAGVKSVSDDCFNDIRQLITSRMHEVVGNMLLVNAEHQTKTLMSDDVYKALVLMNVNLTESTELGTATCSK